MIRMTPLLALMACAAPETDALFNRLELSTPVTAADANEIFVETVEAASDEVRIALPTLTDMTLATSLIDAHMAGVEVLVTMDIDQADDEGVIALQDAGVPVQLGDAGLTYFEFSLNDDVTWPSEDIRMSHAFVVADQTEVVMANQAGDLTDAPRVVVSGHSEDLGQDLNMEHVQLFGGADATAVTAFDSMAKSIADFRWNYSTQFADQFELWLGPQERVGKRLIDGVYSARSGDIRLMSDDVADESIVAALEAKAADGFDVEVLVGPGFGTINPALSNRLENAAGVRVLQTTSTAPLPTILFLDYERGPDGRYHMPRAMVATHEILSAARLFNDTEVVTDQLVDGALYMIAVPDAPSPWLQQLASVYLDAVAAGVTEVN